MIQGTLRPTALAILEFEMSKVDGPLIRLSAKAAFCDPATGNTHGFTNAESGWSPDTMQALKALMDSMERDMGLQHFVEGSSAGPTEGPKGLRPTSLGGLGEHVAGDGTQV